MLYAYLHTIPHHTIPCLHAYSRVLDIHTNLCVHIPVCCTNLCVFMHAYRFSTDRITTNDPVVLRSMLAGLSTRLGEKDEAIAKMRMEVMALRSNVRMHGSVCVSVCVYELTLSVYA